MGKESTHKLVGDIASNLNHLPRTAKEIAEDIGRDQQSVKAYLTQLTNLPNVEKKLVDDEWYYYRSDSKESRLLEELADLEHRQWMKLTKYYAEDDEIEVSEEKMRHWESLWKPYSQLSEEQKEKDRKWARKALEIVKNTNGEGDNQ